MTARSQSATQWGWDRSSLGVQGGPPTFFLPNPAAFLSPVAQHHQKPGEVECSAINGLRTPVANLSDQSAESACAEPACGPSPHTPATSSGLPPPEFRHVIPRGPALWEDRGRGPAEGRSGPLISGSGLSRKRLLRGSLGYLAPVSARCPGRGLGISPHPLVRAARWSPCFDGASYLGSVMQKAWVGIPIPSQKEI